MKAMTFLTQYILIWSIIGVITITTMLIVGAKQPTYECIDGSFVVSKKECPQCTNTSHCPTDHTCDENMCIAKPCRFQSDCDNKFSQCIYQKCTPNNAEKAIYDQRK
jgi:hypothetical protein